MHTQVTMLCVSGSQLPLLPSLDQWHDARPGAAAQVAHPRSGLFRGCASRRHSRCHVLREVRVCNSQINIDTVNQTFEMRLRLQALLPVDMVHSTLPSPITSLQSHLTCTTNGRSTNGSKQMYGVCAWT